MRIRQLAAIALLAAALPACTSFDVNVDDPPPEFPKPLVADGYLEFDGLREYDGSVINFQILGTGARKGELLHVEVWPFAGVGIGLLGFLLQVLPLDVRVGTILYEPSAPTGTGIPEDVADDTDGE